MHKLTQKLNQTLQKFSDLDSKPNLGLSKVAATQTSSEQLFYRYRKQRGVNLGSWFVLERWIAESPYRNSGSGQSDLDVAGSSEAKRVLEEHWDNWIVREDWEWIVERGLNTVRIPIGYHHLSGLDRSILQSTDFKSHADVFDGAWSRIKKAIETAHGLGIGVLLDLHAAPGKQNHDSHSGTSNKPEFFNHTSHQNQTIKVLCTLLSAVRMHPNVVGIELLNEPAPPSDGTLQSFYTKATKELREIDSTLPVYLGDCWRPDVYAEFVIRQSHARSGAITAVDHHLYRCFTSSDIHTSASDHSASLWNPNADTPRQFASVASKLSPHGGLIIGEWSGALNPGSLRGEQDEQKHWIEAQLQLYERYCAGWYFWTFKKQHPGDHGWSLRDSVGGGVFPSSVGMRAKRTWRGDESRRASARDGQRDAALASHTQYWSQYPGEYHHHLFSDGYVRGWDDAYAFFGSSSNPHLSVPEPGFQGAWMRRSVDSGMKGFWEYEHGYNQGVEAAKSDFKTNYC